MPERPRLVGLPTATALLFLAACTTLAGPTPPGGAASASAEPIPASAPAASATATASVAPSSTPSPLPSSDPSVLELDVVGCNGGVVLDWSPSGDPAFHHYTALRSANAEIPAGYPPIAPAVDWGETYTTDRFTTSAVDASLIPTGQLWHYRVMAYDAENRVLASSPVRSARMTPVGGLGTITAETRGEVTRLAWEPFAGFSPCFSAYRVLYGPAESLQLLTTVSNRERAELETDALHPGTTYQLRVEAVRTTTLGSLVVGRTETLLYTVPTEPE